MKILITEPEYFPQELSDELKQGHTVIAGRPNHEYLLKEVGDVDALVVRVETKIDKAVLDSAKNLKLIASMTTGLDHIDLAEAGKRGIEVINCPEYATTATAEYTMSIILSLVRNIPWAFESFKNGKRDRHSFLGGELQGKTLGVVGFGKIGSRVAKYAKAFGMDVLFYDPYIDKNNSKDVEAKQVTLEELVERSDVITIHAFLSKETKYLINRETFSKMKSNAVVVNASRGQIIDEDALVSALDNKTIAGAALDVFGEEPLPHPHKLTEYARSHNNLLLTPHIAGSTKESVYSAARLVIDKILETPSKKSMQSQSK